MNKFKEMLNRFFIGRYGIDNLNRFLIYLSLGSSMVSLFLRRGTINSALSTISMVALITSVFRALSRNFNTRYQENVKFLKLTKPVKAQYEIFKLRWRDRNTHRYVKCDRCKTYTRIPKNVGKIKIKCRKCGNEFIKRT